MMCRRFKSLTVIIALSLTLAACSREVQPPRTAVTPPSPASPSPPSPLAASPAPPTEEAVPITLPVLDALLADEGFRADLKSKLQLTDEQIGALRKISGDEVAKLRRSNAENQSGSAEAARQKAINAIREVVGDEKMTQVLALARERWNKGSQELEAAAAGSTMLKGPNAIPNDTRIVVNIPAFRMDVFRDGTLLKSYKIGIGYQQFPLPTGFRKAEMIVFNPTWTQPNESWASNPGEVVPAGSKSNPLGPIKIPIGGANLIHGGKPLAKIGTFASHGCVGLTNAQVKDFAKVLADASHTELSTETMAAYLKRPMRTQVVKLKQLVPVELRYETIVVEDGKLHIYRDVYNQNTNTEENLRAVLEANGANFDELTTESKAQMLEALSAMSRQMKKQALPKPTSSAVQSSANANINSAERKVESARAKKLRSQKEIVIEVEALSGKGYPGPMKLDSGTSAVSAAGER